MAKDEQGQVLLIASGRIISVPRGTKVRVIDIGTFIRKIRVLEGSQEGLSGWVAAEYVKGE